MNRITELVNDRNRPRCPFCGKVMWWKNMAHAWGCTNPGCVLSTKQQRSFLGNRDIFG